VDVLYITPKYWGERYLVANPGGLGVEALVGRDAPLGWGVGILWGIGASGYFISGGRPDFTPSFRLGLHLDI
jgi:hypothetical protein